MKKNIFAKLSIVSVAALSLVGCSAENVDMLPLDSDSKVAINETAEAAEAVSHIIPEINAEDAANAAHNVGNAITELSNIDLSAHANELENTALIFENASFGSSGSSSPNLNTPNIPGDVEDVFYGRNLITIDSCNLDGMRQANVVTDVGYGDREYWAYTNEHGQLEGIVADEIILQQKSEEKSNGRYCWDEAKVPGVESTELDEGHVIADSLGGVSNSYNITPQNSYLNRYGEQSKMEQRIRNAGGAYDFTANIYYANKTTQIPSSYSFTFTYENGQTESVSFKNKG